MIYSGVIVCHIKFNKFLFSLKRMYIVLSSPKWIDFYQKTNLIVTNQSHTFANSLFKSFEENYYEEYFKENYNQTSARK